MAKKKKKANARAVSATAAKATETSKVVPGAWEKVKARRTELHRRDPKAKAAWDQRVTRNAWRSVKATAKMYSREYGRELDALRRDGPGFAENENADRTATVLKAAMLEARDRSGMTQAEIAKHMGVEPSNLSRLLHGSGR